MIRFVSVVVVVVGGFSLCLWGSCVCVCVWIVTACIERRTPIRSVYSVQLSKIDNLFYFSDYYYFYALPAIGRDSRSTLDSQYGRPFVYDFVCTASSAYVYLQPLNELSFV